VDVLAGPQKETARHGIERQTEGHTMIWDNIETAFHNTMPHTASADELLALGLKYCFGRGVAQSYVEAHKWFNIAALKGSENAKSYRCELAREMSANDIAEAQRQARAWMTLH
jgi:TPR repeat protein